MIALTILLPLLAVVACIAALAWQCAHLRLRVTALRAITNYLKAWGWSVKP